MPDSMTGMNNDFSISTIIPTVGRSSLERAVRSVASQDTSRAETEVIIVNDSGELLPERITKISSRVRMVMTQGCRTGQTAARNLGASIAKGTFFHFLDDDDWMLPGAFEAFKEAYQTQPDARWIYGVVARVSRDGTFLDTLPADLEGNVLAEILSGEWAPFQATLVRRDLFEEVGQFDPEFIVSEDVDLLLRLSVAEDMVRVRRRVCNYSAGIEGSATQRELGSKYRFRAYDRLFYVPGSVERAIESADSLHLYGKVMRHCLIALRDNAWNGEFRRAARRLVYAVRIGLQGITYWLAPDFWSAVMSNCKGMKPNTGQEKRATASALVF